MSEKILVCRSKIEGEVSLSGAKNSALKLLTASLLTDEDFYLVNMPMEILDFQIHIEMLEALGKTVETQNEYLIIKEKKSINNLIWQKRSIRNSLLILGALLTRTGYGRVPLPGGCKIGERKYDIHEDVMTKFGAKVTTDGDYLIAESKGRLIGCEIILPIRSTGGTENCILMGCLAKGKSKIWNPHVRPEVLDLIDMLNKMGAKISVNGQESIEIEGVERLKGVTHACIFDNIEALTFLFAGLITKGEVVIHNFPFQHLEIPLIVLRESGLKYFVSNDKKSLLVSPFSKIYPFEVATGPYPSINSDMQPLFAVFGLMAKGESRIIDLRFPGRYQYLSEFKKLGADMTVDNNLLKIHGGVPLRGAEVIALDLRAGGALVLAGMAIEGETIIGNFKEIERGYDNIVKKLNSIGGHISEI